MKFKKQIALTLALVTCMTTTSCSSGKVEDVDLTVWGIRSSSITNYSQNNQSKWMEEKTGLIVNYIEAPMNGWYSSFQQFVMSGEKCDIYMYPFDTKEVSMLASMGGLIPLEDLIDEYAPNIKHTLDENPELREMITADDGHIYSLPDISYNSLEITQKVYVRKDWLEKYTQITGSNTPETTDEFKAFLEYIVSNDMNSNGKADEIGFMGIAGVDAVYYFMGSFIPSNSSGNAYGCYKNGDGVLTFAYNTEEFRQGLKYMKGLYDDGLYSSESFTISANDRYEYTSGKPNDARVGAVSAVNLANVVQLSNGKDALDYDSYVALPPLVGPEGVRTIMSSGSETVGMRCGITSTCEDSVEAIKWLDIAYSEEARVYSVYGGLENVDWHYEDGNTIEGIGKVVVYDRKLPKNYSWMGQGAFYNLKEDDIKSMNIDEIGTNDVLATYRATLEYRPYVIKNEWPSIVWAGDNMELATEYSELNNLIQAKVTEFYTKAILGKVNLDSDWDSYIQELDEIGVDRYVELSSMYINSK